MYQNSSPSTGISQPELLRQITLDARYLRDVGAWADAKDRVLSAINEWRHEDKHRAIGADLISDWLAADVAELTGVSRDVCQREARRLSIRTQLDAVAAELRQCVIEIRTIKTSAPVKRYTAARRRA